MRPSSLPARPAVVLVIEDDDLVRVYVRRILELYDFQVLTAVDAREALDISRRHIGPLDLILCDLVLPGLDGREAANALLARHPDARVLYTSGYSGGWSDRAWLEAEGAGFLPKPFRVTELVCAVETRLAQAV